MFSIILKTKLSDSFKIPNNLTSVTPSIGDNLDFPIVISQSFGYKPAYILFYNNLNSKK